MYNFNVIAFPYYTRPPPEKRKQALVQKLFRPAYKNKKDFKRHNKNVELSFFSSIASRCYDRAQPTIAGGGILNRTAGCASAGPRARWRWSDVWSPSGQRSTHVDSNRKSIEIRFISRQPTDLAEFTSVQRIIFLLSFKIYHT